MPAGIIPEPAAFLLPPGTLTTPSLSFLHRSAGGLLGYACGAVVCNVLRAAAQDIMVALGRLLFPAFPTRPCECHALSPFLFSFIRSPARASEKVGVVWWCGPPHSQRAAGLAGQATNYTSSRLASLFGGPLPPWAGSRKTLRPSARSSYRPRAPKWRYSRGSAISVNCSGWQQRERGLNNSPRGGVVLRSRGRQTVTISVGGGSDQV